MGLRRSRSWIGVVCGSIGAIGMCWFWARWHKNYIWLCSNIFKFVYNNTASSIQTHYFPPRAGALSGFHGVISTLASYYGQNGNMTDILKKGKEGSSNSSRWTLAATVGVTVVCAVLLLFYKLMLRDVQQKHDIEYGPRQAGRHGEGTGHENGKPPKIHSVSSF